MGSSRIGFYSLRRVAREMCRFIFLFTPTIRNLYPDNATLLAALATANLACEELVKEIDLQATPGV
jgi:hypothetical protein